MSMTRLTSWIIISISIALGETQLTSIPIKFISDSTRPHGGLIMARGVAIPARYVYKEFIFDKSCKCREACWAHPRCSSVSYKPQDGKVQCLLASWGPMYLNLEEVDDAIYIFKISSVYHQLYEMRNGLLYMVSAFNTTYSAAKSSCENIPGHRLGIFGTAEQYQDLLDIHDYLNGLEITIDLTQQADGPVWGNEIPLEATEAVDIANVVPSRNIGFPFRMLRTALDDMPLTASKHFVCQANPLGKDW